MKKSQLFQEDEKKYNIYKKAEDELRKILINVKDKFKNYYKAIIHLSLEDFESLIEGKLTSFYASAKTN